MSVRQSGSQLADRYINLTAANPMEYIRHTICVIFLVQLRKPIIVIRIFWHTPNVHEVVCVIAVFF